MRILLAHNFYRQFGGEDRVFEMRASLLEAKGHTVWRFERDSKEVDFSKCRLSLATSSVWNQQTYNEVSELVRREKIDIVHVDNFQPIISPSIFWAAKDAGAMAVMTAHNFRLSCPNGLFFRDGKICESCKGAFFALPSVLHGCYQDSRIHSAVVAVGNSFHNVIGTWKNKIDVLICPSQFLADQLTSAGLPLSRVQVIPHFIDMYDDVKVNLSQDIDVLFVGRLSKEKGLGTLLDAWDAIEGDYSLNIVGDGPLKAHLEAAGNRDLRIRVFGPQDPHTVRSLMARSRLLVMPSDWYETFGLTVAEAASVGTPAVVPKVGAAAELVSDGRTGFHFESRNPSHLSMVLSRALKDREGTTAMRAETHQSAMKAFSADAYFASLMNT